MRGQMPCAGAAHRKASYHHAIAINVVLGADGVHGLGDIYLPGEFVGITEAAIRVQDDGIGGSERTRGIFALGKEREFSALFTTTRKPDVEWARFGFVGFDAGRND